jgi:hypothetical protein
MNAPDDIALTPAQRVGQFLTRGDDEGALQWLRAEAERQPDDVEVCSLLADQLLRMGSRVPGLEQLRALADLHLQDGRVLEAIAVQKRILEEGAEFLEQVRGIARGGETPGEAQPDRPADAASDEEVEIPAAVLSLPPTPLFSDLQPGELEEVVEALQRHRVEAGWTVVREGDAGDSLFVVVSGALSVTMREDGQEVELAILREGDFFGEVALLTGQPRSATVRTLLASELLEMKRHLYEEVVARFPRVRDVMETFCRDRAGKTVEALRRHHRES